MEETPALIFKYKCRRNMFVARPATCRPALQTPTPIVSFHHRPARVRTTAKESHTPIVASFNPLKRAIRTKNVVKDKVEPELKETATEQEATNKEVTLEFQRSYNSSLHLNVSPSSSIKFDRRNASSRIKLLAVVQRGESVEHSEKSTSTDSSPKCFKQLPDFPEGEEENSTSLKSPGNLNDTAMELPLWAKVSHFQGNFVDSERPGSVGDIETVVSEEPRPIQGTVSISGDKKLKSQPFEIKRTNEFGSSVAHQRVIVRQLPLSYALSDENSKLSLVSRGIQCSDQPDGEEPEEENNGPPLRNTAPDSPYVTLHKCVREIYKQTRHCQAHSLCTGKQNPKVRNVSTWTPDGKIGQKRISRVSKIMQTEPPMHDMSTHFAGYVSRQSQKVQTAFHPLNYVQSRSFAPQTSTQTIFDMWDTATISDNSQISADPLSWHFDKLKLQRHFQSGDSRSESKRRKIHLLQSASLDCRGDHSSHYYQQHQERSHTYYPNAFSVSTQTPRKSAPPHGIQTTVRWRRGLHGADFRRWVGRHSVRRVATKSPPPNQDFHSRSVGYQQCVPMRSDFMPASFNQKSISTIAPKPSWSPQNSKHFFTALMELMI
ncbi:hypothetical protein EmuJ_001120600 [Echinococcus multilocularis]|uniref:Uncharacterized protein n=1 Tax=Echinococcus multilocularis TaxID=6211 RepID=A0A068YFW1_ECHMU|nr:hypothetical protein EmuJ_001120600 [Echinococcus multilocularis]